MKPDGRRGFGQGVLGVARFETMLRRLFSVKGVVAPEIAREIQAGINVDEPRVEYEFLRSELPAFATGQVGNVAAQYPLLSFFPTLTGQLYVIRGLFVNTGSIQGVRLRIDARLAGAISSNSNGTRDARQVGSPVASLVPYTANNAAQQITQEYIRLQFQANVQQYYPLELVLYGGGQSLNLEGDTVNTALTATVVYTERSAEPSEL